VNKRARRRDFAERDSWERTGARRLQGCGEYIEVHPLADDARTLRRLKMTPKECFSVDLYWRVNGDVFFVQLKREGLLPGEPVGRSIRLAPSGYVNFVIVVPEGAIDSVVVERELRAIVGGASYADVRWTSFKRV
jgi:hypothetical protein